MFDENYEEVATEDAQQVGTNNVQPEVEPVKFSKKTVWIILMVAIFAAFVLIGTISSLRLTKKQNANNVPQTEEQVTGESEVNVEVNSNGGENQSEITENVPTSNEVSTSSPNQINSAESVGSVGNGQPVGEIGNGQPVGEVSNGQTVEEVRNMPMQGAGTGTVNYSQDPYAQNGYTNSNSVPAEIITSTPTLNPEITASGIVSGMGMYKIGNSYAYSIKLHIVTGNESSIECEYLCPKKTFSNVSIGDTLSVIYALDAGGNISITSISK